ncbi:hypothetical protein [Glycomyces sp. NPDC021274]|uniref:hypothetical protein n=1 Tax=Glycomyces sp. NPDC021274 TaxID=3155120 RepID=UPI0033C8E263
MTTSKRGFSAPNNIDAIPEAAYRDAAGRRYETPNAPALQFATIADYREGRTATLSPSAGNGLVDVLVCTVESMDATGVLLLDGVPIAAGDGRYQFEVAPGEHRLEVQGIDASTTEFSINAGATAHFTTGQGCAVRHQVDFRTQLYRVKDASDFVPVLSQKAANRSGAGCLLALAGVLLCVLTAVLAMFVGDDSAASELIGIPALIGVVALVVGFIFGVRTTGALHKRAKANRLPTGRTAPGRHGVLTGQAVAFPSPQDAKDWSAERAVQGPLMVFDLHLFRLTRNADGTAAYTGSGETLALAHAAGVRAWIDDAEVPCDWAAWHYPLAAGEHRCRVVYGDDEAALDFTFTVAAVPDMTVLHVPIRVFRIWDERTGALIGFPPQIAQAVTKVPQSKLGKVANTDNGKADQWVPLRFWPGPGQ